MRSCLGMMGFQAGARWKESCIGWDKISQRPKWPALDYFGRVRKNDLVNPRCSLVGLEDLVHGIWRSREEGRELIHLRSCGKGKVERDEILTPRWKTKAFKTHRTPSCYSDRVFCRTFWLSKYPIQVSEAWWSVSQKRKKWFSSVSMYKYKYVQYSMLSRPLSAPDSPYQHSWSTLQGPFPRSRSLPLDRSLPTVWQRDKMEHPRWQNSRNLERVDPIP